MKSFKVFFLLSLLFLNSILLSAQISTLPSIDIYNLNNETINTSEITNEGPIIISFWATWCKPCIQELNAINDNYAEWQSETGVKAFAVSIDDSKSVHKVAPFVAAKSWEFDVFLDTNSDFKRAMNVVNVPHSFLLDKTGKIVWQHNSYLPGDEDELYEKIKELSKQ